jgi:hypothetical protein
MRIAQLTARKSSKSFKVKNLPNMFRVRNPRNCKCSVEQQDVLQTLRTCQVIKVVYVFPLSR